MYTECRATNHHLYLLQKKLTFDIFAAAFQCTAPYVATLTLPAPPSVKLYALLIISLVYMLYLCGLVHHTGPVDINIQAKCDPCLSTPCKNDGTCANDPVHYYRCTCPYGFKVCKPQKAKRVVFTSSFLVAFLITHW